MALLQAVFPTPPYSNFANISFDPRRLMAPQGGNTRRVTSKSFTSSLQQASTRRSADYGPSICNNDFIQSLTSNFEGEKYKSRVKELTNYSKHLLELEKDHLTLLELIDNIECLGLRYLFREEINGVLRAIMLSYTSCTTGGAKIDLDLYSTTLLFRISRQNGFMVEQDVFRRFMDENGNFKADLCGDKKGNLSLYDASFLALEGEPILDEARAFSAKNLQELLKGNLEEELKNKVLHVLESPFHWRVTSIEARWSMDTYERDEKMNPKLLELAKLDYNMRQAQFQKDLKPTSGWWTYTAISSNLSFSRDRLGECFLWALALTDSLPQYGYARYVLTQVNQLITTLDDTYDLYGSIEELELLTNVIDKWDINAIDTLPLYTKFPCLALFNSANEVAYTCLKEHGVNVVPCNWYWAGLCQAYFKEAKWYHEGYKPTLDEYIENAVMTISGSVILGNLYLSMNAEVTEEILENLNNLPEVIKWSSMIVRLCDDLATSADELSRGDVLKSVQCSMLDNGTGEEVAREHVRNLISDAWKKINKDLIVESPFPRDFVDGALGLARMSHYYYYSGEDGFGGLREESSGLFKRLLAEPVSMDELYK